MVPDLLKPGIKNILNLYRGTGREFPGGNTAEEVMERLYGTPKTLAPTTALAPIVMTTIVADVHRVKSKLCLRVVEMENENKTLKWTESALVRLSEGTTATKAYGTTGWLVSSTGDQKESPPEVDLSQVKLSLHELLTHTDRRYVVEGCRRITAARDVDDVLIPLITQHLSLVGDSVASPAIVALVVSAKARSVKGIGELLNAEQTHVRQHAVNALAALHLFGTDVRRFESQLRTMRLREQNPAVKNAARNAVSTLDSKSPISRLLLLAAKPVWAQHATTELLSAHGEPGVDAAISLLSSANPGTREGAAIALVEYGKPVVPRLAQLAASTKTQRIKTAVQAVIDQIANPEKEQPKDTGAEAGPAAEMKLATLLGSGKQFAGKQVILKDISLLVRIDTQCSTQVTLIHPVFNPAIYKINACQLDVWNEVSI